MRQAAKETKLAPSLFKKGPTNRIASIFRTRKPHQKSQQFLKPQCTLLQFLDTILTTVYWFRNFKKRLIQAQSIKKIICVQPLPGQPAVVTGGQTRDVDHLGRDEGESPKYLPEGISLISLAQNVKIWKQKGKYWHFFPTWVRKGGARPLGTP